MFAAARKARRGVKLLIVDDSRIIRRKIARCLEEHDLDVIGRASNGAEALEIFSEAQPDVVTMDLTMPEMDGIECVEKLVQLNPAVRILVVSALADKATAIEALKKGANGFLCKPFTERELSLALAELLNDCACRNTISQSLSTAPCTISGRGRMRPRRSARLISWVSPRRPRAAIPASSA